MATLSDLRDRVRLQTETRDTEVTDTEIDGWLQEAFNRTVAAQHDWPFYEKVWPLTLTAGQATIAMPADLEAAGVSSLFDTERPHRLDMIPYNEAEEIFASTNASLIPNATHFSIWADTIYLWPAPTFDTEREYTLRGWRRPQDWIAGGASAEPDCDERLHLALVNYAIALAYIQQEDEVLERTYMERWMRDVEIARQVIMEPPRRHPLKMGPKFTTAIGSRWRW